LVSMRLQKQILGFHWDRRSRLSIPSKIYYSINKYIVNMAYI
jgi:hypothetical protein